MIDHRGITARDFEASKRFYDAALAALGISAQMEVTADQTGGYRGVGYGQGGKPSFWLGNDHRGVLRTDGGDAGSGLHIAFVAESRAAVDAFYAVAIAHGGRDNGAPGIRAHYHPNYYGAFVFDPDGVNVEAVCHKP